MGTKPAADAWTSSREYVKGLIGSAEETIKLQALNSANRFFHLSHPWEWSLGTLSEVTLENGEQDYTITSPPTDYLRLHQVRRLSQDRWVGNLEIVGKLPATVRVDGDPRKVAVFDPGAGAYKYRLWPRPAGMTSGVPHYLIGEYKKALTLITAGNVSTASILPFPNDYYHVYEGLVLYYALLFANDVRAGTMQVASNGSRQATGQLGFCVAAIQDLQRAEAPSQDSLGVPK